MTIQKIDVEFRNKKYFMILEDGQVSVVDPSQPLVRRSYATPSGAKITTVAAATRVALQMLEKSQKQKKH